MANNEIVKESLRKKEENILLWKKGIKKCLCCGYESKPRRYNVSICPKCKSNSWLVGHNYPCEICQRISFTPVIHHLDGNHKNDIIENVIFICMDCHTEIHHPMSLEHTSKKLRCFSWEIINILSRYQNTLQENNKEFISFSLRPIIKNKNKTIIINHKRYLIFN